MTAELENNLITKYQDLFKILKKNNDYPIQFSIECGDGWYWLLDELMDNINSHMKYCCEKKRIKNKLLRWFVDILFKIKIFKVFIKLRSYINKHAKHEIYNYKNFDPVTIIQIKEKFGGLRFYYDGGDDIIFGMVLFAESLSLSICETCGTRINVETHIKNGWRYTRCDNCIKQEL